MSKYIIKNCPAIVISNFNTHLPYCVDDVSNSNCQDCTDCVMKQIVDRCNIYKYSEAIETTDFARREVALKILDLLQIQEIE